MAQVNPKTSDNWTIGRYLAQAIIFCMCLMPARSAMALATAGISAPPDGTTAIGGSTVTFVGSASSVNGTASYEWISDLDGSLGTTLVLSVNTLSVGTHIISFIITDDDGPSNVPTITLIIDNQDPVAAITNPLDGDAYAAGASISFQGAGTDVEDGNLSGTSLVWTSSLNGALGTGSPLSVSTLSSGDHTITLTVTDSFGSVHSDSIDITVNPNTPPSATIDAPADNSSTASGNYINFEGTGTDSEDGPLASSALNWSSSIDGDLGSGSPLSINTLSVGTHTITLTSRDSKGTTGSTTITLTITNTPPTAAISSPATDTAFTTKDFITFIGTGTDMEDGNLADSTLSWSSSRDGQLGTGSPLTLDTLTPGSHTITLTVIDKDDSTGTDTIAITVTNTSPVVTINSPADNTSFNEGATIVFTATATDTEDGILANNTLVWSSNVDGQIGTGSALSIGTLSKGTHVITLTATDSDSATGSDSVTIIAGNTPPTATITLPADGSAFATGSLVTFNGIGTDSESAVTYQWISNIDGELSTDSYFQSTTLSKGKHMITFTVTDTDGKSTSAIVNITTGNAAPTATINDPADGSTYKEGETVSFNGSGTDTEDGTLTGSALVWTSNRDGLITTIGTGVSFATNTLIHGTHIITLTVTDNDHASMTSNTIRIHITPMTVSPTGLSLNVKESGTLTIAGGTPPYKVSNRYPGVADAQINKITGVVTVTGLQAGDTIIVITDAYRKTTSAIVTVMALPDRDSDGIADSDDAFPDDPDEWLDTDNDGIGNNADTDDDGDGMPDLWEALYTGLDPLIDDAALDLDGDGKTNIDEYKADTNPANSAPNKPVLYQPQNGLSLLTATPALMTYAFSDNENDTHKKTRWQIATDLTFSALVTDVVTTVDLTLFKVLDHILTVPTGYGAVNTYYWRAKFFDNQGEESPWSAPYAFKLAATVDQSDIDGNGVPDTQEVENDVDLDENGTPDNSQEDIRTIQITMEEGIKQLALKLSSNASDLSGFKSISTVPDLAHAPRDLPFGLITFRVKAYQPGETVKLKIYLSEAAPQGAKWYKYDPENGWEDYSAYAEISADGFEITLFLQDGGFGDADGIANGVIIDPSGLSVTFSGESSQDDDGDDSGCFLRSLFVK